MNGGIVPTRYIKVEDIISCTNGYYISEEILKKYNKEIQDLILDQYKYNKLTISSNYDN